MARRGKARRLVSIGMMALLVVAGARKASRRSNTWAGADLRVRAGSNEITAPSGPADTQARPHRQDAAVKAPSAHTDIHFPAPSIWPSALAFGVTLVFFGVVTSQGFIVVGSILTAVAIAGWIGELRHA